MTRIPRTLGAAALALSLAMGAVTATATPARANENANGQAVAIIGGLIALYAIGQAIRNDDGSARAGVHRSPPHDPGFVPPGRLQEPGLRPPGRAHEPGFVPPGHQHRPRQLVAPARCFIDGRDAGGYFRGYVRRCMQNNVARPDLLPQHCLRRVETHRGPRMIYAGRCLAQNGWVREAGFRP